MSNKGKDSATPPFTMNSNTTGGTFSLGTAPAGQGDLSTTSTPAPASTAAVTAQIGNLAVTPKGDDDDEEFPSEVINRLVGLKQLQEEYESLEEQYKAERIALEKKYFDLRNPILTKRSDVLNGKIDVEVESETPAPASTGIKGIPGFWLQCIANHPTISSLLGEHDGPALEALTDIKVEYTDDYSGFKLTFCFAPNDYFSNETLVKSYTVNPDLLDDTAPALTAVDGTEINWKDKSKNLCETETKKKQKSKKGGQTRYVTQMVAKQSFFHYFGDPHMADEDDEEEEEGGDAQRKHEFQLSVDADYEIGHMFRTEIIPSAILWFTGEADGGIDLEDDEDEEDDEGEDDEEDEDDEENPAEESEEVDATNKGKSRKGKGSGPAAPGAGAAGEQPECKQS